MASASPGSATPNPSPPSIKRRVPSKARGDLKGIKIAPLNVRKSSGTGSTASSSDKHLPPTPPEDSQPEAVAEAEQTRSTRPNSIVRVGSGDSGGRARNGKGVGPKLPVNVVPAMSAADGRNANRETDDDEANAGESSVRGKRPYSRTMDWFELFD